MELEHSNVEDLMFRLLSLLKFLLYVFCLKLQCEYFKPYEYGMFKQLAFYFFLNMNTYSIL